MSLETCAQLCGAVEAIALSPGSYDTAECYCLSRLPSAPAVAAAACSSGCPGDAAQLCGGGARVGTAVVSCGSTAPSTWVGYDGKTCGECAALVKVRDNGGTCEGFCSRQGLSCVEGWDDETNEQCSAGATVRPCDHSYGSTSDAICKCGDASAAHGGGGSIAVVLSAYGTLAEYEDATRRKALRTKLGVAAGVGHDHVAVHFSAGTTSGAVVLSATVRVPMAGMLDTVQTALSTKLATGALASTALGVTVEGGGNKPSVTQSLFASVYR